MSPRASTRRLAALLWLSVVWLLLSCVPALAHATLVQETPATGARLDESPEQARLRFNEPVDAEFDPLKVIDAEGNRVDEDDARIDPNDARVLIEGLEELPKGSYRVEWRVTSLDGHVISGEYGFSVTGSGGQGSRNDAGNGNRAAARSGEGTFGVFPRTVVYGALSVGTLALVVLLGLLVARLARRRRKA
jgi:methionine-rich copper-binding protein CopC